MKCRYCRWPLKHVFLDLGSSPTSNAYLRHEDLSSPEPYYPLKLMVCERCWLVQTVDYAEAIELFRPDYAYFSSVSQSWLDHSDRYTQMITTRLGLGRASYVIEIGANDGYLLKSFVAAGIPCLGIEPTRSTWAVAESLGIPILPEFFDKMLAEQLAAQGRHADLIIGNNVYAHVPDINDFTEGLKVALRPGGTITLEFPHLMRLIERTQFDTVYHEHFSYLSLQTVQGIFTHAGLRILDVEELLTHGGSLRVYGCHADDARVTTGAVGDLLKEEERRGLCELAIYENFQSRADRIRDEFVGFLKEQKRAGRKVGGYGAAAKGNTLLNYAGVGSDLLPYVCDAAPSKIGKFLPGSHIPIVHPSVLRQRRPDVVLILPWNIADEVIAQQHGVLEWGGKFVVAVPELREIP